MTANELEALVAMHIDEARKKIRIQARKAPGLAAEIESRGMLELWLLARRNDRRSDFGTYLSHRLAYLAADALRKAHGRSNRRRQVASDLLSVADHREGPAIREPTIERALGALTPTQRELVLRVYRDDEPKMRAGAALGLTRTSTSLTLRAAIERLRNDPDAVALLDAAS